MLGQDGCILLQHKIMVEGLHHKRLSLASNYRGKLWGVVLALLILWAARALEMALLPGMILYCNNKGVISHANCPLMSLPEKQEQADLIQLIKHLTSNNRTGLYGSGLKAMQSNKKAGQTVRYRNNSMMLQVLWPKTLSCLR